jgi:hypothetical protein
VSENAYDVGDGPVERIRAALRRAEAHGVGCDVWSVAEYGLSAEHLESLRVVALIKTRVPTCEDHGCAWLATCEQRAIFDAGGTGKSGRKFKLTVLGERTVRDPDAVLASVESLPLSDHILTTLASAGGALSSFELYWRLCEPELAALAADGTRPSPPITRRFVRFHLDLLGAVGLVDEDVTAGMVRRIGWRSTGTLGLAD